MMGLPHLFQKAGCVPVIGCILLVFLGASLTGKKERERERDYVFFSVCVSVCVCVCERERVCVDVYL